MCQYKGTDREYECEFASEYEKDEFFPLLLPALKAVAPVAIKAVGSLLGGQKKRQREFEFEYESEYEGDPFIGKLLSSLGSGLGLGEGEYEYEYEYEAVPMSEYEIVMENLAYRAAHSESEAEAEAFLGALASMATRLVPSAAKAIASVTPSLVRGVARMGSALHKNPTTRQLLQTAPTILKGTVQTLANQVEQGKPLSSTTALRALAGNTANVLDNPQKVKAAMKKSHQAQHQAKAIAQRSSAKPSGNGKRRQVPV